MSTSESDYPLHSVPSTASAPDDLLEALRIADVWELYCSLPIGNQDEFARWIQHSPDQAARWRRIDALVLALRLSPLMKEDATRG
jgi:hypothetical protein